MAEMFFVEPMMLLFIILTSIDWPIGYSYVLFLLGFICIFYITFYSIQAASLPCAYDTADQVTSSCCRRRYRAIFLHLNWGVHFPGAELLAPVAYKASLPISISLKPNLFRSFARCFTAKAVSLAARV